MARKYYEKAAEMGSPEGHFSYAMLLREGKGGITNVPLAVVHLAVAASRQHLRSINFLAHALFDPESWLGHFSRVEKRKHRKESKDRLLSSDPSLKDIHFKTTTGDINETNSNKTISRWRYNTSKPIFVELPGIPPVQLPYPLRPSCQAALPLLKYISEMGYRTNDLNRAALSSYLEGDLWEALQYYDELADMGVTFGQENSVFIYKQLRRQECDGKQSQMTRSLLLASQSAAEYLQSNGPSHSLESLHNASMDDFNHEFTISGSSDDTNAAKHLPNLTRTACFYYFDRMIAQRLLQESNLGGRIAYRELANQILIYCHRSYSA